jgi:hypothetical protein
MDDVDILHVEIDNLNDSLVSLFYTEDLIGHSIQGINFIKVKLLCIC